MSSSESVTETNPPPATVYSQEQHGLTRSGIDEDARKIVFRLQRSGFKAYVVGGGVRDLLIGKTPKDFDISTDATPREIKSLFRNCRIIGRRFKLAHIFFGSGKTIEVSTFRDSVDWQEPPDAEGNEGTPPASDNIYGTESTDAFRRDLTINGLFLDVSTMEIIDYVGGMDDLKRGIVRVIGEPTSRFIEDPVRMIRVVRHSARNGFQIERSCWQSILENAARLSTCSQVRVFDEIKKDLGSGCFLTIINLLAETGLLNEILPELLENNGRLLSNESDFSRCLEVLDDLVANGEEIGQTPMLAILALFTMSDSLWLRDIIESFEGPMDIQVRLGTTFTKLTVPKKERERIVILLQQWLKVKHASKDSFKAGSFKRSSLLPELITLLDTTVTSRDDEVKIAQLRAVDRAPHDMHSHREQYPHPSGERVDGREPQGSASRRRRRRN